MFETLVATLKQHANISDAGIEQFIASLKIKQIKKKKNLLTEGDSGNMMYYVNEGLFRNYIFDDHGTEHTIDFIAQNNWFGDAEAFLSRQTAGINIEALEDSQVFALNYEDLHRFYDEIPMFERAVRKIIERYFVKALRRGKKVNRAGYSAQERYQEFLKFYPKLDTRVPAIYLSSYLGLTPETLSRLRSQSIRQHS